MARQFHRSISFKKQMSVGVHSKPQIRRQNTWAATGGGPALGRCLSIQEGESHPRDLKVVVEEKVYHLHSGLLNKASPAFSTLVSESKNADGDLQLDGVTAAGFDEIVNWIYHERVDIKAGHLLDVYEAAKKLEVEDVEKMCDEYIESTTNPELQAEILQTCLKLNLDDLLKHVLYTRPEIVMHQATLDNLELSELVEVLGSDYLNVTDERVILKAANRWITHKNSCEEDVVKIIKVIRLGLLNQDDLEMILEDLKDLPSCPEVIKDAISYLSDSNARPLKAGDFCKPRGKPKCFIFGGLIQCEPDPVTHLPFKLRKTSLAFPLSSEFVSEVDDLASMPDKVVDPVTLSKNNFVFAIGGYVGLRMTKGDKNLQPIPGNLCLRYEPRIDRWDEMAPLKNSRWCHGAAWCNDHILVIGGVTKGCLKYGIGTVELYDIKTDSWSLRSPFPYGIRNLAACDLNNCVYISGGCVDYKGSLNSVDHIYEYDYNKDLWNLAGYMSKTREYHSMAGMDDKLFIVGGSGDVTAEIFDPETHQSTLIKTVPGHLVHTPLLRHTNTETGNSEHLNSNDSDSSENKKSVLIPELVKFNIAVTDKEVILAGGVQQTNIVIYNTETAKWEGKVIPFNARRHNTSFALLCTPSGVRMHHRRKMSSCSLS